MIIQNAEAHLKIDTVEIVPWSRAREDLQESLWYCEALKAALVDYMLSSSGFT